MWLTLPALIYTADETKVGYELARKIKAISVDNQFMQAAKLASVESNDKQHQTGAVLVKDNKIIKEGSNRARITNKKLVESHSVWCIRRKLQVPSGHGYWLCPGCSPANDHPETRIARFIKRQKIDTQNSSVYLYGHYHCCETCLRHMTDINVTQIYVCEGAKELFKR